MEIHIFRFYYNSLEVLENSIEIYRSSYFYINRLKIYNNKINERIYN